MAARSPRATWRWANPATPSTPAARSSTISSGGSLTLTDTDDYAAPGLRIGQASGSDGAVTVQGAGSSLTVQGTPGAIGGTISLGRYGTGALEVLAGAEANAFWVDSSREGGDSLLRVDGAGSVLRLSDAYGGFGPGYGGYGGFLRVARNDTATGALEVTGGGRVEIGNSGTGYSGAGLQMARNGGSYAQGLISGAGSAVEVVQTGAPDAGWRGGPFAQIGSGGRAEMEVADGGLLALRGAAAVLTVGGERNGLTDPTGSALQVLSGGRVVVDSEGYGGLFTLDLGVDAYGAPITADVPVGAQAVVGGGYDVRGGLQVDGAGSSFTVRSDDRSQSDYQTGQLLVGVGGGYGDLHVSNGGAVDVRALGLGGGGYGVARVESGGAITVTGSDATAYQGLRIGQGGGGEGDLTIDGAGSTVTVTGIPDANGAPESAARWTVGREGYGTVSVTNGGTANGFSADIGRGTGGDGSVSVDGRRAAP
jgi:T5SS/PEP-CTERM-associated repeat protein